MSLPVHAHSTAAALLVLADAPILGEDEGCFLHRLASEAAQLPGVDAAGCSLTDREGRPRLQGASDEVVGRLERMQLELYEGPCRDVARSNTPLTDVPMLHAHSRTRWPRFAPRALEAGFTAVTALPLRHQNRPMGVLDLYHRHGALHADDLYWSQLLAGAAALGLAHRDLHRRAELRGEQLQTALNSRVLIEQAKGMLAERFDWSLDHTLSVLRRHARSHQMKLIDLAAEIVNSPATAGPFPRPSR